MAKRTASIGEANASPPPKAKVMIYVSPQLQQAMRLQAVSMSCSVSDLYARAASKFLENDKNQDYRMDGDTNDHKSVSESDPASINRLLKGHGQRLEKVLTRIEDALISEWNRNGLPQGAEVGYTGATRSVLRLVRAAGPAGLAAQDLMSTVRKEGYSSPTFNAVKITLHAAGLIRYAHLRWYSQDL